MYLSLLMSVSLGLAAVTWFISPVVFCVALPVTAVVCGLCIWQLVYMQRQIHNLFDKVMDQLDAGQRHYLHDFPLPVVIVTGEREVVWYSESFREKVIPGDDLYGINLDRITKEKLPDLCGAEGREICCRDRWYRVYGISREENGETLITLYFVDITQLQREASLYQKTRPSVMLIMLDNYGEVMQHAKESEKSRILGAIDSTLEDFISSMTTSFIKRLDGDKFLVVAEEQHLERIIASRFKILDDIRSIQTDGNLPVTLSIGVGRGEETLAQSEASARQALDMAVERVAQRLDEPLRTLGQVGILHKARAKFQQRHRGRSRRAPDENLSRRRIQQKCGKPLRFAQQRVIDGKTNDLRKERSQQRGRQRRADAQRKRRGRRLQMMQQQLRFFAKALLLLIFFHVSPFGAPS